MPIFNKATEKRIQTLKSQFAFLAIVAWLLLTVSDAGAQIIAADRRIIWQGNVGVPGGIPIVESKAANICQSFSPGATADLINTALSNCTSGKIVYLNAGTYSLTKTLNITKSGVILRGAGTGPSGTTITTSASPAVNITSSYTGNDRGGQNITPNMAQHKSWMANSNFAQGSTSITVTDIGTTTSTSAPVQEGQFIFLDQLNDANTSAVGTCGINLGDWVSPAYPADGRDRYQHQLVRVTKITGNVLTISPGLFMPNWNATLSPGIWWMRGNLPIEKSGVEDLTIVGPNTDSAMGVAMSNSYGCWAKNVNVSKVRYFIRPYYSLRYEVRHCAISDASVYGAYGIYSAESDAGLIEDNTSYNVTEGAILEGSNGTVVAYNYFSHFLSATNWMKGGIETHASHPTMNLFEGNYTGDWQMDNCWGSAYGNTAFRNRFTGVDESNVTTNFTQAVDVGYMNRYINVVGNVLGTTGINTFYEANGQKTNCHDAGRIYFIGYFASDCYAAGAWDGGPNVNDAPNHLLRVVNWDSAHNAIIAGDGSYTVNDLPASLYLPGKPAYFGNLKWPPIDPGDPVYSSNKENTPAAYRYKNGMDPPTLNKPAAPVNFRVRA